MEGFYSSPEKPEVLKYVKEVEKKNGGIVTDITGEQ
jgi:hypothetical protein